jgi:hypothetical protein
VDDRRITEVAARVLAKQADCWSFRRRFDATAFTVVAQTLPFFGRLPSARKQTVSVILK